MTPLSVSSRSDQTTSTPPATIQVASGMTRGPSLERMSRNRKMPSTADSKRAPQVTSCAPRSPITRPKKPAISAAISGRKTTATATQSALHHVDVLDRYCPAVAEIDDEDGETDCRLGRRNRQHKHGEGLADEIVEKDRERDEIDADGQQHHDVVLAVDEYPKNSQGEQNCGHGQIMGEPDRHYPPPLPMETLTTSTDWARGRASCAEIDCRRTSARCRKVSMIAPTIATSRISPAA